ncbi:hypothetical protein LCGC14_0535090 [marine sediment metagenome]|uniref:Uncharacterized protein n=1 Tax=marine sediment metagenome TaxID=412755 RepID=A0A0F9UFX2_9ZZZZ
MTTDGRTTYSRVLIFLSTYPKNTPIKRADFQRKLSQIICYEKYRMRRLEMTMIDWGLIRLEGDDVVILDAPKD